MRDHLGNFVLGQDLRMARGISLLDDFEGAFLWTKSGTGGNDTLAGTTLTASTGLKSMLMKTRTTTATVGDQISATRWFSYPEERVLSTRMRWLYLAANRPALLEISLMVNDGVRTREARLRWAPATGEVYVVDGAGGSLAVPGLDGVAYSTVWGEIELAIDVKAHRYIAAILHGRRVDLSAFEYYNIAPQAERYCGLTISAFASATPPAEMYIDDVVVSSWLEV